MNAQHLMLLDELETRQDAVIRDLDQLNARVEQTIRQFQSPADAAASGQAARRLRVRFEEN